MLGMIPTTENVAIHSNSSLCDTKTDQYLSLDQLGLSDSGIGFGTGYESLQEEDHSLQLDYAGFNQNPDIIAVDFLNYPNNETENPDYENRINVDLSLFSYQNNTETSEIGDYDTNNDNIISQLEITTHNEDIALFKTDDASLSEEEKDLLASIDESASLEFRNILRRHVDDDLAETIVDGEIVTVGISKFLSEMNTHATMELFDLQPVGEEAREAKSNR